MNCLLNRSLANQDYFDRYLSRSKYNYKKIRLNRRLYWLLYDYPLEKKKILIAQSKLLNGLKAKIQGKDFYDRE
jgi:hypothetical protein